MRATSSIFTLSSLFSLSIAADFNILNVAAKTNPSIVPQRAGFKLTWSDTFSQSRSLSGANWIYDTGTSYPAGPSNWGTGEIQTYTASSQNVYISPSGYLTIVPVRNPRTGGWTSARVETVQDGFKCQAGGQMVIEARILLPGGGNQDGVWAAFWAMGRKFRRGGNHGWPGTGEWDIMEAVNGGDTIVGTVHCGVYPGGPCDEPNGVGGRAGIARDVFNNYALRVDRTSSNWQDEYLAWSVNGAEYHRVYGADIGNAGVWSDLVHEPFFLLLNVAMGGGFPNAWAGIETPTSKTSSGYGMLVDWVAVYNR
ncbi:hypothetical protein H072_2374 [Dactylellina haptotyla CBS 200.50]|uniref:GH16 domain-containing protein n=1 Tax=Dactylellina haptotyla (strain CBS 200.50) TaxID=1284197 RepID=S8AR87_DACHA|nr:hypothetical protein H072_2374 [Dactylellina haptotyla CBS 200.50]